MRFGLLGPLLIERDGVVWPPEAPKVRQLIALLLILANQVVSTDLIVDELWGAKPPRRALVTLQTYVCRVRKVIGAADELPATRPGSAALTSAVLATVSPGYVLSLSPEQLDVFRFRELADSGRTLYELGKAHDAAGRLREALALNRGPVLMDVASGPVLRAHKVRLEEDYSATLALRIQADLALGRHRELIGELKSLTTSRPLDEWAHARLMEALSGAGRRSEALDAYRSLRTVLDRELGIAPSPELQSLQHDILTSGQPATLPH